MSERSTVHAGMAGADVIHPGQIAILRCAVEFGEVTVRPRTGTVIASLDWLPEITGRRASGVVDAFPRISREARVAACLER